MGETSDAGAPLSPEQCDRIRQEIAAELGRVWDAAVAAGASPETLAAIADERRRAIESALFLDEESEPHADDLLDDPSP